MRLLKPLSATFFKRYIEDMKFFYPCFLFFSMGLFSFAQMPVNEKDSTAIVAVLKRQEAAWNQGDIPLFMEGYLKSPNIVFSGAGGPKYGWEAIQKRYLKTYANKTQMGQLTFNILSLKQWVPHFVMLEGHYALERTVGNASGFFSLGWIKKNGQWFVVHDHTSATISSP